ncbi:MAG TPA: PEGA domain-containing protein [Candidatus Acidoferrales bacterium]|nr:PEGA domain-containing protein [Candidatus Acidoferrales bacterium]
MRFSLGLATAAAALITSSAAMQTPARADVSSSGGVYVTTLPSGADVWVDGTYCGPSPVLVDALAQGRHAITLTKTGWNVQEVDVDIPGGGITLSSTKLAPGTRGGETATTGTVVVRGLAAGAKISIDGAPPQAVSGPMTFPAGSHTVTFDGAQGATTRSFTVLPETTSELVLHDIPTTEARAGVIAPATDYLPPDAIDLDGRRLLIHYLGHEVVAHLDENTLRLDGSDVSYDSAPSVINGKLYLPLDLLETITK